jgi:ribosomal protein S12 methylthiotransferase
LEFIATEEKICKYIDTPVQHINDRMLRLMNRKITGDLIRQRLARLRERIPQVAIRSNLIVGYPGETDAEFEELRAFVQEARFDHLGVFAYSLEEGTASYSLPDQIDEETKNRRREELMALQQKISHARLTEKIGEKVAVLVEGISEESEFLWKARHAGQAADIDGYVLLRGGELKPGQIVPAQIEKAMEYDLIGRALPVH